MPNLTEILAGEPKYRLKQIYEAWFSPSIKSYEEITVLSKQMREKLKGTPWTSVKLRTMVESKLDGTKKALLELSDGQLVETVLMGREDKTEKQLKGTRYTICISSQVGCPMACVFCATGCAGFQRNLTAFEIIDQVRYWQSFLGEENSIDNIVLMGQGEPLLNYDNVKEALRIILDNTEIGPRHITLSSVGVRPAMEKLLKDKDFPSVRFSLSLHSALEETRMRLIPAHQKGFLEFFADWALEYHKTHDSRALFIGLEYIMIGNVNDDDKHLKALIKLSSKLGRIRINLIPYNAGAGGMFTSSPDETVRKWHDSLMKAGFIATVRRSQGQDIAAACGQLANQR